MPIESHIRYRRTNTDVHQRTIAGLTVLHRSTWDEALRLTHEMNLVWTCLEAGGTAEEISNDIADVFGYDLTTISPDVESALQQLADLDLIEPMTIS